MQFLASLLAIASVSSSPIDEHGYNTLFLSRNATVERQCVDAPALKDLSGSFVISSLGQFEMGNASVQAAFDAFGKLHKFHVSNGRVCVTTRIMATSFWNASVRANTIAPALLFMDTKPPAPYSAMEKVNGYCDNAFVNTYRLGGRTFSVTDSPFAVEVDLGTLRVTGDVVWDDAMDKTALGLGSAHPLPEIREDTQRCMINIHPQQTIKAHEILVFRVCDDAPTKRLPIARVDTGTQFAYFHAFGLTARHVVLPLQPLSMHMTKLMHGHHGILDALTPYNDDKPMPIVVQPLDGSAPLHFTLPGKPSYFVHVVNTFEASNGTDGGSLLNIDVTTFGENYFATTALADMLNATKRNTAPMSVRATIMRWTMHLDGPLAGSVDVQPLSVRERATDFPQINPRYHGRAYCYYWAVEWFHDDLINSRMAIVKQDVCTGARSYWYREGAFPSEPTLVPTVAVEQTSGGAEQEDDGKLLFTIYDGETGISSLIVADAASMTTVSETPMPREAALGFTAHGQWYATAEI